MARPVAPRRRFLASLTSASPNTVAAYGRDLGGFVDLGRAARARRPEAVDRTRPASLPRLPGHPQLRQAQRRPQGLGAAPLLRLAAPHRRARGRPDRRAVGARRATAACPRVLRDDELTRAARRSRRPGPTAIPPPCASATTPCSSCSTAAGCGWPSSAACAPTTSTSTAGTVRVWGKGSKQRIVPLSAPAVEAVAALARRRPGRARRPPSPRPTPCSSTSGANASRPVTCGASSTAAPPPRPTPTRCATPSPRTCSTVAPTCARCRSCSVTPTLATTQHYTHVSKERLRKVLDATHPRA